MPDVQRQYLIFVALLACLFALVSLPAYLCSQDIQSPPLPPLSGAAPGGAYQKNEIAHFLARFNGCAWYKTPGNPYADVYLELKDGTLILYEYLKNESYCSTTFSTCFTQHEIWRTKVTGWDMILPDRPGNVYRIVMDRNGETIAMHGVDNAGRDYMMGIFVRLFCSGNI